MAKITLPVFKPGLGGRFGHPERFTPFTPGNQLAKGTPGKFQKGKQVFAPESLVRKKQGLLKAWSVKAKMDAGKYVMTKKRKVAKKARLRATIAKEAREIQNRAREYSWHSIEELAKIIDSPSTPSAVKVSAIALMHERAYGKPSQTNINANVDANGKPSELGPDELDARITQTLKRVENLAGRARKEAPRPEQPPDIRKLN